MPGYRVADLTKPPVPSGPPRTPSTHSPDTAKAATMPNPITFSAPTNAAPVSIEGRSESNTLHLRGHVDLSNNENVITAAGLAAVLATLSTYWSGLTTAKMATLVASNNGVLVHATQASITAAVLAADQSTVAASLATNVTTSGNTARG